MYIYTVDIDVERMSTVSKLIDSDTQVMPFVCGLEVHHVDRVRVTSVTH